MYHQGIIERCCAEMNREISKHTIYVSLSKSMLYHYENWYLSDSHIISYSRNPISQQKNSFGTPLGLHEVAEKYGDNLPLGTILKGRVSIHRTYFDLDLSEQTGHITSRILRLAGLQSGFNQGGNCDSYERYIYIHGTSSEELIGQRISKGCLLMKNRDVIELYDVIPTGSLVMIAMD
jgi:hypothetical protein